jgi:hypothetical protein
VERYGPNKVDGLLGCDLHDKNGLALDDEDEVIE